MLKTRLDRRHKMKKIKPIIMLIPENSDDLFIDVSFMNNWRKEHPFNEMWLYTGLVLGFGKNVFVFDKHSCEFF
ncbi:MAG: hypothetical protein ACTSPV_00545 [Candidatus Hodarchaeales archaeon]